MANENNEKKGRRNYRSRDRRKAPEPREMPKGPVRAFGERLGDGLVQLSFTLPVSAGKEVRLAARMYAEQMGLKGVTVQHMESIDDDITSFVVYGYSEIEIDVSKIVEPLYEYPVYNFDQSNQMIREHVRRRVVVLGACLGTEAQSAGMDAIFNMKGYMGDYGLERYPMMDALNLRGQTRTSDLLQEIKDKQADVVLISRVIPQKDSLMKELKKVVEELDGSADVPKHLIKICSAPKISHQEASEMGYDAGFGPGTMPSQVASYIVSEMVKRIG